MTDTPAEAPAPMLAHVLLEAATAKCREHSDTITRLTAEVERLKSDNELRDINGHNDALKAEYFEKGRATLTAEVERKGAAISKLESELASVLTDLNTARQDNSGFGPEFKRLTADNERLRAALEEVRDSGLLWGPTVLHDKTLATVYAALNEEPRT